ncbi:MAG: hypothetical protein A3I66_02425 [Burkholderiales bacterium RIFCSPLOWO2_02_FULL_57_36]|nr:MAG: hypothetical protein A3I66_02425 [Burkholderiales bacterium RIFCSPLOWO2_02_FULL_57_36]
MFSGPLIWAVHFVAIYGFIGIVCARPAMNLVWLGIGIATWGVIGAGFAAIAAIAAVYLRIKPRDAAPDNRSFIRWMSLTLSLLSAIAVVWETMAIFLVPACA